MDFDLGDMIASFNIRIKQHHRHQAIWHVGVAVEHGLTGRATNPSPVTFHTGKASIIVDLQADKQVPLSVTFTDEMGNPVTAPEKPLTVFTVDDPAIIALTDNLDGTAVAAAVGPLGTANVHVSSLVGGNELTGDLAIVVVEGLAERITVTAGEPVEVTPDTVPL
jgi:hypothetical protein